MRKRLSRTAYLHTTCSHFLINSLVTEISSFSSLFRSLLHTNPRQPLYLFMTHASPQTLFLLQSMHLSIFRSPSVLLSLPAVQVCIVVFLPSAESTDYHCYQFPSSSHFSSSYLSSDSLTSSAVFTRSFSSTFPPLNLSVPHPAISGGWASIDIPH